MIGIKKKYKLARGFLMARQRDPWWRFQDLIGAKARIKPDKNFIPKIDQAIEELEALKKTEWIDQGFSWNKTQPILDLVNELDEMHSDNFIKAWNNTSLRLWDKLDQIDPEIKTDESVKRLMSKHLVN